jgi:hypothetical protein
MNHIYRKSLAGLKVINTFPNPIFYDVEYNNEKCRLHLITDENNKVFIRTLTDEERAWYCPQIKSEEIIMLSCEWFPKELIAGVYNGRYDINTDLSRATGWVQSFNTGSSSECFRASRVYEAIYILEKNGFIIQY